MTTQDNIRIVLVDTTHAGNIGAAARAMKTMGLRHLYLVKPRSFPSDEATARASGADDVLQNAVVCESFAEALSGCIYVAGTSARKRSLSLPLLTPEECARTLVEQSSTGSTALVFGRESRGLTNEELDRCRHAVQIPTNPEFSSLNIAAAVQIMAYELAKLTDRQVLQDSRTTTILNDMDAIAPFGEAEGFYQHLETALVQLEFLDPDNPRQLMRHLRRLYGRVNLSVREVNILRGILTACQRSKR